MDYTTLERVKLELGSAETADDDLLEQVITSASRELDRRVTGVARPEAHNYFLEEDVSAQVLKAFVDASGYLTCYPHKPVINSIAAFAYRGNPLTSWSTVDLASLTTEGSTVIAWILASALRGNRLIQVQISYNGGFSDDPDTLPADLVEAATVLAARFYREGKTGLTDSIGVAEMGTMMYTKAVPLRVKDVVNQYRRVVPW